jgi:hypothetical protein
VPASEATLPWHGAVLLHQHPRWAVRIRIRLRYPAARRWLHLPRCAPITADGERAGGAGHGRGTPMSTATPRGGDKVMTWCGYLLVAAPMMGSVSALPPSAALCSRSRPNPDRLSMCRRMSSTPRSRLPSRSSRASSRSR